MIISRKKYEMEIAKAVANREEQMWKDRDLNDRFSTIWRRMDDVENRLISVEKRLAAIDGKETGSKLQNVTVNPLQA